MIEDFHLIRFPALTAAPPCPAALHKLIHTPCLNKIACFNEQENLYLFDYRSEVSDAIGNALGIDFTRRRLRLSEIKNILANSKK